MATIDAASAWMHDVRMTDSTIASSGADNTATPAGNQSAPAGQQPAGTAAPNPATQQPAPQGTEAAKSAEGTSGDQKTSEQQDPKAGDQGKPQVPEKYELKLPDGAPLDAKHLDAVAEYAKELGLSQEQAQKLVERDASLVDTHWKGMQANHAQQVQKWADTVKSDKELGGANFDTTVQNARRVVDRFGDADLKKALNDSGYGNHPALVRLLAKVGKAMSEDSFVDSKNPPGAAKSAASILYGSGT